MGRRTKLFIFCQRCGLTVGTTVDNYVHKCGHCGRELCRTNGVSASAEMAMDSLHAEDSLKDIPKCMGIDEKPVFGE